MEELRSTEILDKEIISDANKKAERILMKAEYESKNILAEVENRVAEELQKTEIQYQKKLQALEKDFNASVPLEKERFYVSFIQDSLIKGINEYLKNLSVEKQLEICTSGVKKLDISDKTFKAFVYGFDKNLCEKALKNILGDSLKTVEETAFNQIIFEETFLEENKGIILFTENEDIKCRFTLSEKMQSVLEDYRQELFDSLFGKGAE